MHENIQRALKALERANYAGYFEELGKVVPDDLKINFSNLRNEFVTGRYGANYENRLSIFAKEVDEAVTLNNTPKPDNNNPSDMTNNELIKLIESSFDDVSLQEFAFKHFEDAEKNFGAGQSTNQKIMALIKYCKQHAKLDFLIQKIKEERLTEPQNTSKTPSSTEHQPTPNQLIKDKVLMFTANPAGTAKLNLDKEHSRIAEKLNNKIPLSVYRAISREEFREKTESKQYIPTILHFSGHGEEVNEELKKYGVENGGLVFQNDDKNGYEVLNAYQLDVLFEFFKEDEIPLKIVILNACYSKPQAEAIAKHVEYVIGTTKKIKDKHAIAFSTGFYSRLVNQRESVEKAFKAGRVTAVMDGAQKSDFVIYHNQQPLEI